MEAGAADGKEISVDAFVRVRSVPFDGFRYPAEEEALRRSAVGRICQVCRPYEGAASDDGIRARNGFYLLNYAVLTSEGVGNYGIYAGRDDLEVIAATEEMVLLYSKDLWQLIREFGHVRDTPTFRKLAAEFGYADLNA